MEYRIQYLGLGKVFVRNMKKWRKSAGISQEKLAERCDSAHSYIRQIECGSRCPSFAFIEKIAHALNIAPYRLFYDESAEEDEQKTTIQLMEAELLEVISREISKTFGRLR